jgi:ABC-type glycerol-3-phosphate transport system substrate-binding protein
VANAKAILSALIFQAGNPITEITPPTDIHPDQAIAVLGQRFNAPVPPTASALDFYTQFADPAQPIYSWNKALPLSTEAFLSGELAVYFGFASELAPLQNKNPNLNFDVAQLPQLRNKTTKTTFGNLTGLALVRNSKNSEASYGAIRILTASSSLTILSSIMNLPPTRLDLLASPDPTNANLVVFDQAALQSRAWLDPDPVGTQKVFQDMVESIESGNKKTGEAVDGANTRIQNLIH